MKALVSSAFTEAADLHELPAGGLSGEAERNEPTGSVLAAPSTRAYRGVGFGM
jgi:hypothetical protein